MIVVGVDPGAQETGFVLRCGETLLSHVTMRRQGADLAEYVMAVTGTLAGYVKGTKQVVVAVEDVVAPNPHLGITNPSGIIGAAVILGAVINEVTFHDVEHLVVVPPSGNGKGPMVAYPAELRPTTGQGRGHDSLRHERSAWDIGGAARLLVRLRAAR